MPLKIRNSSNDWSTAKNIRLWGGSSWTSAKRGKIWNGLNWVTFFDSTSPIFLPPSINLTIYDNSLNGTGAFYGYCRIEFYNTGILKVIYGSTPNPETINTYTWRNSGSSSDYEVFVTDPSTYPPFGDGRFSNLWTEGQLSTQQWIDLNTPLLKWTFAITVPEYYYPTDPSIPFPTPVDTYTLKSQLAIALDGNPGTAITCPVEINLVLGV